MSKWRPIKTAPKDQMILLAEHYPNGENGWNVFEGRWIEIPHENEVFPSRDCSLIDCVNPVAIWNNAKQNGHWSVVYPAIFGYSLGQYWRAKSIIVYPSHWMPSPKPPTKKPKRI